MQAQARYKLNKWQSKQNNTFLKPLMTGADDYGLNVKISESELGFLRSELNTNSNSGNKYGATQAGYQAKINKATAVKRFKQVCNDLTVTNRTSGDATKIYGYNILIANKNATAEMVQSNNRGYMTFTDSKGNNLYQSLVDARRLLTSRLNKQRNKTKKSIVGTDFSLYGLYSDMESVLTALDTNVAILNAHIHMMLMINSDIDVATFKANLNKLLNKQDELYINIEPITTDYPKLEHPAVIDTSKSLRRQETAINAFSKVINYNRKQVGFNDYGRAIKNEYGNITELTQEMALTDLSDFAKASAVVAMVNTFYGLRMHENSGILKADNARKLHVLARMVKVTLIYQLPINERKQSGLLAVTYLFNLCRFKPPPP